MEINYKTTGGTLKAKIEYNGDVPQKDVESIVRTLMEHAESHLKSYPVPPLFNEILAMRKRFLKDVLQLLAEAYQTTGKPLPDDVRKLLVGGRKVQWDPEEEQEDD